jgi:diguanylate cyclase (GGDEF)-like protein/PAS domain S-box-containing protein
MALAVHHDLPTRLEALRRLLDREPRPSVVAIEETGLFTTTPELPELAGCPRLEGRSGVDLVHPRDRKAVVDGWLRLIDTGLGRAAVRLVTGDGATFSFVDLRDVHGVILGIIVPDSTTGTAADLGPATDTTPRLARVRRDERGIIIQTDDALPLMLRRPIDEILGHSSVEVIVPEDHPTAIGNWMEMLASPGQVHRWRGRYRRGDGSILWVETINTNRLDDPDHGDILTEIIDISEEMAALEALRASEQLLRRLTDALPEVVIQLDARRRIVHANGRLEEMLGLPAGTTFDEQFATVLADEWPRLDPAVTAMLDGSRDAELEVRMAVDGAMRVLEFALRGLTDSSGRPAGGIVCVSDVTERTRLRTELEVRATSDALTGCHNRASIMAVLGAALQAAAVAGEHNGRRDGGTAAVFVDIDRFKAINDRHGHATGDGLLVLIADRLRAATRSGDVVGRLGGDEFLVVCPDVPDRAAVRRIGRRIEQVIGQPAVIDNTELVPRASVGIAWSRPGSIDAERLVAAADGAMYASKAAGIGRTVVRTIGRGRGRSAMDQPSATEADLARPPGSASPRARKPRADAAR